MEPGFPQEHAFSIHLSQSMSGSCLSGTVHNAQRPRAANGQMEGYGTEAAKQFERTLCGVSIELIWPICICHYYL